MTRKPQQSDRERRMAQFSVDDGGLRDDRLSDAVSCAKRDPPRHVG